MKLSFAAAGNSLTRAGETYRNYYEQIHFAAGGVAFLVPAVAAWITLTPWAAIPATISSAILGLSVAAPPKKFDKDGYKLSDRVSVTLAGVVIGGIVSALSGAINYALDRNDVPGEINDTLATSCWSPGKIFQIKANGKIYTATINEVDNKSLAVDSITSTGTKVGIPQLSHSASAIVTFGFNSFWTSKPKHGEDTIKTADRPGFWNKESTAVTLNGQALTLKCE